ncbi:hemerythrin domain-containing protein [Kitasatospora sp. NPDC089509]|uniref:hemerythrin domain-containing protein n=1 Tax=Kitasatospora sp. NPDC089509 TaxID=3364079 RepID=UPI0037FB4BEB
MASPVTGRTAALSLQLSQAHRELRRRLANVRTALGRSHLPDDALLTHCLAFCTALTSHHQGEDEGLFAALVRERPDLAPTVAKLVEDHGLITGILTRVRELTDEAATLPHADLAAIGRELDGLAAVMESHFRYEERAIGAALDAGVPDADTWQEPVLRFRAPKAP